MFEKNCKSKESDQFHHLNIGKENALQDILIQSYRKCTCKFTVGRTMIFIGKSRFQFLEAELIDELVIPSILTQNGIQTFVMA